MRKEKGTLVRLYLDRIRRNFRFRASPRYKHLRRPALGIHLAFAFSPSRDSYCCEEEVKI